MTTPPPDDLAEAMRLVRLAQQSNPTNESEVRALLAIIERVCGERDNWRVAMTNLAKIEGDLLTERDAVVRERDELRERDAGSRELLAKSDVEFERVMNQRDELREAAAEAHSYLWAETPDPMRACEILKAALAKTELKS